MRAEEKNETAFFANGECPRSFWCFARFQKRKAFWISFAQKIGSEKI